MNRPVFLTLAALVTASSQVCAEQAQGVLADFYDNAEYELDMSVTGYFDAPASRQVDQDDAAYLGRFTLKSQASLLDNIRMGFDAYATYSTQDDEYRGIVRFPGQRTRQPRYADFNTLWLRYDADDYELLMGKDYIENGFAELYSPVDRFGLTNVSNPTLPYKMGVWQAGIDYFIGDDTLSFKWVPVHEKILLPTDNSRWFGLSDDPQFTFLAQNTALEEKYYPVRVENMGYLLKYKGTRAGYDFYGLAHHGPSLYPSLLNTADPNLFIKQEPLAFSTAAGVLKVIDQWKLYAEAIYQQTYDGKDADFIRYSAGLSYQFDALAEAIGFAETKLSVQWSGDETLASADANKVGYSSRKARLFRNTVLVKTEFKQNDEWSYYALGVRNAETDYSLSAGIKYKPNDNLFFNLEGVSFNGPEDTQFGRWGNNDFLRLRTIYKF
ncbi:hypothetical protein [Methylomonas methanica]|uniref:Porin n=1 Tax=Methylomonas methanica (strain DSM 25384 / MC09) TaxID=857087 RepID=G0A3X2_METMM|nr:hypothetical protein [Methylomonas methanica]AEG02744.1 hypothetical protein Metme_4397 [Methylomonas methanica MC09]